MDANTGSRRAVGLVLVVFVLGIALGALGTYLVGARVWGARREVQDHRDRRARLVEQFTQELDRKSTRLNSSHIQKSRMPSSA